VKWDEASVVLFQKLGSFFLRVYTNTWDAQPAVELPITLRTVVTEHFINSEKRQKVAVLVISNNGVKSDSDYSINLGDAIIHLTWIQAFLQTPAAVAAASITRIVQKAFPTSITVAHADYIVEGGKDSGFAYTLNVTMSDGVSGSIMRLERDVIDLHEQLTSKNLMYQLSIPAKGMKDDNPHSRAEVMTAYFSKLLSFKRMGRSAELLKWVTADENIYSSSTKQSASDRRPRSDSSVKSELNMCVTKFSLHSPSEVNLAEILSRYSIDTAHFCYCLSINVDGKSVAQSDLFYDMNSPDIKPLFIPLNLLPQAQPVCLKLMVLCDKSRIEVSSIQNWQLVEGVGCQFSGVFYSDGNHVVELRSKSRLTFMKSQGQDTVDHAYTFHLQANEAIADNHVERALALNLVALSWWQRHKMMHTVFCKVLMESGSLYFLHQNINMAVEFLEAGLAHSHRLKLSNNSHLNAEFFQNDVIADGLQELAMARLYLGNHTRSISCLLEALYLKQQFYFQEELDDVMLEQAANKISVLYTQLLFVINEALSSGTTPILSSSETPSCSRRLSRLQMLSLSCPFRLPSLGFTCVWALCSIHLFFTWRTHGLSLSSSALI
jgi:hypothetical protein